MKECLRLQRKVQALKLSSEIECSVCLERVLGKARPADRKFGILSHCDHPFCVACIRNWRAAGQMCVQVMVEDRVQCVPGACAGEGPACRSQVWHPIAPRPPFLCCVHSQLAGCWAGVWVWGEGEEKEKERRRRGEGEEKERRRRGEGDEKERRRRGEGEEKERRRREGEEKERRRRGEGEEKERRRRGEGKEKERRRDYIACRQVV
ncbi:unnamed protein product [Closterium sp. NIES-53]